MVKRPLILEIKGNSLDDGPGIRSVVFFKGCPLSCVWCHNPEGKAVEMEISFDADSCVGCKTCQATCHQGALSEKNPFYIDRKRCDLCFDCLDTCPSAALKKVGREMSVEEIVIQTLKDKPFFETSKGGVTLSGGEPLFFMDFTSNLLRALKEEVVHTLVETCGLFSFTEFETKILPFCDTIYLDLKLFDSERHKAFCGVPNGQILETIRKLRNLPDIGGTDWLIRVPLIPEITDTEENLSAIAAFLEQNGIPRVRLLNYNPLWIAKNRKIGVHNDKRFKEKHRLSQNELKECQSYFTERGIDVG